MAPNSNSAASNACRTSSGRSSSFFVSSAQGSLLIPAAGGWPKADDVDGAPNADVGFAPNADDEPAFPKADEVGAGAGWPKAEEGLAPKADVVDEGWPNADNDELAGWPKADVDGLG